jgi:peptidoglycan/LPS O-acetylase OafA/YrhL
MTPAALGGLLAWLNVFGLLGTYHLLFRRPTPVIRYLAGASYWIYLIHFPIVGLVQADLFRVPLPTALKFAATWALTMGLGVATYQILPRRSEGPREGPRPGLTGPHGVPRLRLLAGRRARTAP